MRRQSSKKSQNKKSRGGSRAIIFFWMVFAAAVVIIFLANSGTIKKNYNLFKTRLTTSPAADEEEPLPEVVIRDPVVQPPAPESVPQPAAPAAEQGRPPVAPSVAPPPKTPPEPPKPPVTHPVTVQTRDRNIYFTHIDKDGQILRSRVTRKIPVSDSPMQDALNVLLAGPSADELNRGILNLIPQNTRLLSATVRGSTAYINFSEDFMFNTFGVEGYAAQLRQIVWTVTEFSTVGDVQILVEGRRLDYLGEGIWIGSPISRQSF